MKIIATCFVLAFAIQVQAAQIKLATITTDTLNETTIFYLETNNDDAPLAMRYVTTSNDSGQIIEDVHSRIEEVLDGGVVLQVMEGREIIRLFLENYNPSGKADVRLYYLANGVTGKHANHALKILKIQNSYALTDSAGNIINTIFVKGNWSRILRRWIGVSSIITSFDAKNN